MDSSRIKLIRVCTCTILIGSCTYLTFSLLKRTPTVPEASDALIKAMFAADMDEVENHLFESERERYKLTSSSRTALKQILDRGRRSLTLLKVGKPGFEASTGAGRVVAQIKCNASGRVFEMPVPSYLTPNGSRTGLAGILVIIWMGEFYNANAQGGDPRIPDLIEAMKFGQEQDGKNLERAGLREISQDGIRFSTWEQQSNYLDKLFRQFTEGA